MDTPITFALHRVNGKRENVGYTGCFAKLERNTILRVFSIERAQPLCPRYRVSPVHADAKCTCDTFFMEPCIFYYTGPSSFYFPTTKFSIALEKVNRSDTFFVLCRGTTVTFRLDETNFKRNPRKLNKISDLPLPSKTKSRKSNTLRTLSSILDPTMPPFLSPPSSSIHPLNNHLINTLITVQS